MFDVSQNLAMKCQPSHFSVNFLDMDGLINQYTIWCFVGKKYPNKDLSWSKSEKVYTRLYLNKLESIMRALSDALPTGHRAMTNPTLQFNFGCGRSTPQAPLTPSNWSALYRGRGSPVMSWIYLKANNGQLDPGVGDKRCFRFKRNALYF